MQSGCFGPVADLNNKLLVAHIHNAPWFACCWPPQMWTFMLQYIQSSAKRSLDPREVVQFLFKLRCDCQAVAIAGFLVVKGKGI